MRPLAYQPQALGRRLLPRTTDLVAACLYSGVLLDYLVIHHQALLSLRTLLVLLALLLLVASERWELSHFGEQAPPAVRAVLLGLNLLLIEAIVQLSGAGNSAFLYVILPLKAWIAFGRAAGYLTGLGVFALYSVKTLSDAPTLGVPLELALSSCILFATAVAFVLTISHLADEDRRALARAEGLLGQLERSHQELALYAAQVGELATAAERNRIARDIHDSLGHYLTALNIQLEKALAFHEHDRAEAGDAVQAAKGLAKEALADVRRSVGLLRSRPEPFSLAAMLRELVAAGAGRPPEVGLQIEGDEAIWPVESRLVLFRVAQEGLTNTRRHAQARRAELLLRFTATEATLRLSDDGVGLPAEGQREPGFGLRGIAERVALARGTLNVGNAELGGVCISVVLPAGQGESQQRGM